MSRLTVLIVYGLYLTLSIALFFSTEPFANDPHEKPIRNNRRLSDPLSNPPTFSAFQHLTNQTPSENDVIVAVRCDLIREDEMIDICTPSSKPSKPSKSDGNSWIVQREALAYDREINRLTASMKSSEIIPKLQVSTATSIEHMDESVELPDQSNMSNERCNKFHTWAKNIQVAMASVIVACVTLHTMLIAFSAYYLRMVIEHSRIVMVIRMIIASLIFAIGTISILAMQIAQEDNAWILVLSALLYVVHLVEACIVHKIPND